MPSPIYLCYSTNASLPHVQREIKRFLRRICGIKANDETRKSAKHLMTFFDTDHNRSVDLDEFCRVFLDAGNFPTHGEADMLLTTILSAFRDYKRQRAADPERAAKLSEMLEQLYDKGQKKHVCALFICVIRIPYYASQDTQLYTSFLSQSDRGEFVDIPLHAQPFSLTRAVEADLASMNFPYCCLF